MKTNCAYYKTKGKVMNENIAVILINYNGQEDTIECLKSLCRSSYKKFGIIIVDNNSKDTDLLQRYIENNKDVHISLLFSENNVGFAGGNNLGIEYAKNNNFKYIMLLNNDTVVDEYLLDNLIPYFNEKTILAPKIYYYDYTTTLWSAGGDIVWKRCKTLQYGLGKEDLKQFDEVKHITFATGCCLVIPINIIKNIGLLDEEYFMYFEDVEYCARAITAGFNIKYIPQAKLWHKISASSKGDSKLEIYYTNRNRLYFMKQYSASCSAWVFVISSRVFKIIQGFILQNNNRIILKSIIDYIKARMGKTY